MSIFKNINEKLDTEKREKEKEKADALKRLEASIDEIADHFDDILEALEEKGYKAQVEEKDSLEGKVIEIKGQKSLGLFYYVNPSRKAIAVELNNGKTKIRHDFMYAPGKAENTLEHRGEDVPIKYILSEHYEALLRKLENQ